MKQSCRHIFLTSLALTFVLCSEEPAPKPWTFGIGLSYLGTGGNTSSHTLGSEFTFLCQPDPWGLEGLITYSRGDQGGNKISERLRTTIKGSRKLQKRWNIFLSGSFEHDRFAGYDGRLALSGGASWKPVSTDRDELVLDAGMSWNRDFFVSGSAQSYLGGMTVARYTHTWSPTSRLSQRLLFVPNFARLAQWHGESETALTASLIRKLTLRGSFLLRYTHRPPPGFKRTDTTSALSLVFTF
jgi:putative salt-induced outer membrane protein